MDASDWTTLHAYYSLGRERERLSIDARGALEFERTTEIISRRLPAAPAVVADIGGGPGRYSLWLAQQGYQVEHRDLMPLHVAQLRAEVPVGANVSARVADARELDLPDESVDAVLLLGPLYHLRLRADRIAALAQARRIVRPGGPVFVAAISRWAPRLDGELRQRLYQDFPVAREISRATERSGWLSPLRDGGFAAYCHRPGQLRTEVRDAGFEVTDLVSVEGAGFFLSDLPERRANRLDWEVVLDAARATERVPELLGVGPHLLATAARPGDG